ncbi:CGNR zinc finger domain-containing protein [Massilia sp. CMS3.1]|uniref:CGNR zinc finger domain-containing protein n=1 Tax=Massilia sp. CMS3.1 TaxID=3373083 RepID=UPI003EE48EDD
MEEMTKKQGDCSGKAPMVGDHLAMDLLNTKAQGVEALVEYWKSGDDVLEWLADHDISPAPGSEPVDVKALLAQAYALRTSAHEAISRHKRGEFFDVVSLNAYLDGYMTSPKLLQTGDGELTLQPVPRGGAIASLLGPVAESVAKLLVHGDFDLVRQCEHPECILWFYDRTKAHKRRWCSMASCGNRYKAAQFRKRNSDATDGRSAVDG